MKTKNKIILTKRTVNKLLNEILQELHIEFKARECNSLKELKELIIEEIKSLHKQIGSLEDCFEEIFK